jgi:hypothetical protein
VIIAVFFQHIIFGGRSTSIAFPESKAFAEKK